MQLTIPNPIENIMAFIYDRLLDDLWLPIVPTQYITQAANVAFVLAFVTVLSSDDAATVASRVLSKSKGGKRKR